MLKAKSNKFDTKKKLHKLNYILVCRNINTNKVPRKRLLKIIIVARKYSTSKLTIINCSIFDTQKNYIQYITSSCQVGDFFARLGVLALVMNVGSAKEMPKCKGERKQLRYYLMR